MKKTFAAGIAGITLLLTLALSGCGLKGPLYMPDEPPAATGAAGD
ncbi:LPS translocon maturation chaperone LptM [Sutterella sp.]|nr:lipoprotein [uncultured Sutterella sp.]